MSLSVAKLKPFQDELTGRARSLPAQLTDDRLDEHLRHGDSRAAVVVRTQPDLLVAAYSDELDCVILLRFDSKLATRYGLTEGSRLLTVNTYGQRVSEDLQPGPKAQHRWTSVYPVIAEFLSDDMNRIRARKQEIAEEEWKRALDQGRSYVEQHESLARSGNPYLSGSPSRAASSSSPAEEALRSADNAERAGKYEEALQIYRDGAEKGDARAQMRLGWLYLRGSGVTRDDAEAFRWFRKAAEQGEPHAAATLGEMYGSGLGVPANDAEAVKWIRVAADAGVAAGQLDLGIMYRSGRGGLPQDDAKALEWFRAAAAQGNAQAAVNVGTMYEKGIAVPKDLAEAAKWYAKAAEGGLAEGQRYLGDMYANGMGVPKDPVEAARWYTKAAGQGDATAKQALARMQSASHPSPDSGTAAPTPEKLSTFTPSFPIESRGSGPCRLSVERPAIGDKPNQLFVITGAGFAPDTELKVTSRSENESSSVPHAKSLSDGTYKLVMAPAVVGKTGGEATVTVADGQCSVTTRFPWGTATTLSKDAGANPPTEALKSAPKPTPSIEDLARRLPDFNPIALGLAAADVENQLVTIGMIREHPDKVTVQLGTERVDRSNFEVVSLRLEKERSLLAGEIDRRGSRDVAGEYEVRAATQGACDLSTLLPRYKPSQPLGPVIVTQDGHSVLFGGPTPLTGNGVAVDQYLVLRTGEPQGMTPVRMVAIRNTEGLDLKMSRSDGSSPCSVGLLVRKPDPPH